MVSTEEATAQERLLEEWARQWSSHDLDGLVSLVTDDVVAENVAQGAVFHGKAEFRAYAEAFFAGYPDARFELSSRFATGRRGGTEWVMHGTHLGDQPGVPATGKPVELRGASMFEFAGGKIQRSSDYLDTATMLRQLGLMPAG